MLEDARIKLMSSAAFCETQRTNSREPRVMDVSAASKIRADSLDAEPTQLLQDFFKMLDKEEKGFLEIRDLRRFISEEIAEITFHRTEMILRRFDRNQDGKIDIFEFLYLLSPLGSQVRLSETLSLSFSRLIKISHQEDPAYQGKGSG